MPFLYSTFLLIFLTYSSFAQPINLFEELAKSPSFQSHRISSTDPTGGNNDRIRIEPGETVTLAEIEGPGAITHIWNTIDAERYYSRMLILRFYWDGQKVPSIEVPLGDFFGVGHGLNRPFDSLPVSVSGDGRARNCFWYMPFAKSARITVTHEGFRPVRAFYYYIDYRTFNSPPEELLYFHAQYRQAVPNPNVELQGKNLDGKTNYVFMETEGKGKYIGTVLSVQTNREGWFGEGDDIFFIDGSETPRLVGTGTEDYFNDSWGFREFSYPFHGVTLWEGREEGDRGTAYRWHVLDPIAFHESIRATIEHGHANERQDDFYSVAFWYQTLPSPEPPTLSNVLDRLPDEGQLYAQRIFLNKTINTHLEQGQLEAALQAVNEFEREHENADAFGYISLRRAMLLNQMEQYDEAEEQIEFALKKSQREGNRWEADADFIQWIAERELEALDSHRNARMYVAGRCQYEIYLEEEKIAEGEVNQHFDDFEISLSRGDRTLAVKCTPIGQNSGLAIRISYPRGVITTDSTWKVSNRAQEEWFDERFDDSAWSNAQVIGRLGEDEWETERDNAYYFKAPILTAPVIWSPSSTSNQILYFRKTVDVQ